MAITPLNLNTHIKRPEEVMPIEVGFGKLHVLPLGATKIVSATASAKRWKKGYQSEYEQDDTILLSTSPTVMPPNETTLRIITAGGLDGYNYVISIVATFDNGSILKEEVYLKVTVGI